MSQEQMIEKMFGLLSKMDEKMVTKDQFEQRHDEVVTHIDGFVKLHETLDVELTSLRRYQQRLEERILVLEKKVGVAA